VNTLTGVIGIMTPLLFAAAGGLFTELSGFLNIALEGLLLSGAFAAAAVYWHTGSFALSVLAASLASASLAAIMGFSTLRLRSNVFITGLAANLLSSGLAAVISQRLFGTRGVILLQDIPSLPAYPIPLLGAIPGLQAALPRFSLFVYGSWLLLAAASLTLYRTPFGYRLRACARHEEALVSLGLRPDRYRFTAFLISGACCGAGGAFLSLNLGAFVPNMAAGKGWIALVLIYLGGRRPRGILAAAGVFALGEAFSNYAQGRFKIPPDCILAIPYIFTLLAMIAVSIREKRRPPG
jgi:simple sugar transport system permease protein